MRRQLKHPMHFGYRAYDVFWSFCQRERRGCSMCDRWVWLGCWIKCKIEEMQAKRILRLCPNCGSGRYEKGMKKCEGCPHLIKTNSAETDGHYDLYCDKYNIRHYPVCQNSLDILNCVECQRNFEKVTKGE